MRTIYNFLTLCINSIFHLARNFNLEGHNHPSKEKNKYQIFQSYLKDAFDFHLDKVEILELRTDKEQLEFIEVLWINTFEAEEHLKTYDLGTKPVCHTLCGYASGYLSTVLQQPILVKEIECRAMGHEHFKCICMPISEGSLCQKHSC